MPKTQLEVFVARILIADDDVILTEMLRFRLEAERHEVSTAPDGMKALEKVNSEDIDLVVLDSMMPVVAGPEVLARLKSDDATKHIPVVMLTSRKGESDIIAALEAGADEYLTKPFIPKELIFRINKLLTTTA